MLWRLWRKLFGWNYVIIYDGDDDHYGTVTRVYEDDDGNEYFYRRDKANKKVKRYLTEYDVAWDHVDTGRADSIL